MSTNKIASVSKSNFIGKKLQTNEKALPHCYGMRKKIYNPVNALIFYNGLPASPLAKGIVFEV